MTKTLPKGDAKRAMTLQALRAGPMTAMEMTERWSFGSAYAQKLCSGGLVETVGDEYRITPAGRAVCPCRNPLAATAATPPEIFTMPRGETRITRDKVFDAICAAGPQGITRKSLQAKFGCSESNIDNHIMWLAKEPGAVIQRPKPGLCVATRYMDGSIPDRQYQPEPVKTAEKTASTAADTLPGFTLPGGELRVVGGDPGLVAELAQAATDMHGVDLTVDHHDVADLPAHSLAAQMAQIGGALPAIVEDIHLSDPDTVEFAIYSSGGLDIFCDDCAITLDRDVLVKRRGFLGLFQEVA